MRMRTSKRERKAGEYAGRGKYLERLFIVVLALYPLRHIGQGLDFWDTGYSYANFQYMGTEHMDPMWLFSTYLANAAGHLMMRLPGADTLMGMNFYTGLIVSALALAGYFFCSRKVGMPRGITFAGELMAVSLCWCPSASLYNYLTYLFFLASFILLYYGLSMEGGVSGGGRSPAAEGGNSGGGRSPAETADSGGGRGPAEAGRSRRQIFCLAGAGVLLGTNVLVRFSNLAEAAMILAVWAYDVILWLEEAGAGGKPGGASVSRREGFWHRAARHTFWCLLGYAAALAVWFGYLHLRYGMGEYIAAIRRLFAMTETAADYKTDSMVRLMLMDYVENLYWVLRIGVIASGGVVLAALSGCLEKLLERKGAKPAAAVLHWGVRVLGAGTAAAMLCWLYGRKFCSLLFYSYDPIRRPCILFLMLAMLIGAIRIFHRDSPREEKLLSGMLILVILLTSIGSNNRTFPSWNNLFVAAPYTLWESWRFVRGRAGGIPVSRKGAFLSGSDILFPVKALLLAFLGMCLFQSAGFGAVFVFAESTGVQNATACAENLAVLKNIRMSPERAQWMTELGAYVGENGLEGKEVILYGGIPALSYYLQMPSAFNPWSDLASYGQEVMESELAQLGAEMARTGAAEPEDAAGRAERPVIILENVYALYAEGGADALTEAGYAAEGLENDGKWALLLNFMEKYGYRQEFRNGKFAVYR